MHSGLTFCLHILLKIKHFPPKGSCFLLNQCAGFQTVFLRFFLVSITELLVRGTYTIFVHVLVQQILIECLQF